MSKTVGLKDLKAGMKVANPIIGIKGDIKVNKGEVLSQTHVEKLNKWNTRGNSVNEANPKGFEVESSLETGTQLPSIVDRPDKSPVIQQKSKENLQKTMRVDVDIKDGKVVRDEEKKEPEVKSEPTPETKPVVKKRKSKKKKS